MTASISVLIITFNRPNDTLALLENIRAQKDLTTYVGEILLLNNASTESYAEVESFIERNKDIPIKYFKHTENLGVAGGRNYLIQRVQFPYSLVLDDDIVFEKEDGILKASALFSKKQFIENNTAVITLNIFYFDTGKRQKNALPHKRYNEYKDKEWFLTYYFTGAGHIIRNEVFRKVGLYPENFFYGMEEYDLSYRIIDAGYSLGYDNGVKILHKESSFGRTTNREKLAMMWYNKCVVAWRYLPKKYFYSTAFMWSLQFLKRTNFHFFGFFKNIKKIAGISKKVPVAKINQKALKYLDQVGARLWY